MHEVSNTVIAGDTFTVKRGRRDIVNFGSGFNRPARVTFNWFYVNGSAVTRREFWALFAAAKRRSQQKEATA